MKMFALSPAAGRECAFSGLVSELITSFECHEIVVGFKETYTSPWSIDKIAMPEQISVLIEAVKYLSRDEGFFSLYCKRRFLLIPFEGLAANVIVPANVIINGIAGLEITDATAVLDEYSDMYSMFDLESIMAES